MDLLAGAARREITPPAGVELMGYGARPGVATGVRQALHARALWLANGPRAESGILINTADLCLMSPAAANAVRKRLAGSIGLPRERILVGCTHTHSGPDTGIGAEAGAGEPPAHVAAVFEGLVRAGEQAFSAARPARLGWGRSEARIGRNRRLEDGPLEPEVGVLRVDGSDGKPLAVLYHHGCHATVLGHDNLEISADWPGVASARVERETGATALFLLGAHADIDPRTRAVMDPAIPGQSVGLGFPAAHVLGTEVAEAVLEAHAAVALSPDAAISARCRDVSLPLHLGDLDSAGAERELARRKAALADDLGVALDALPRLSRLAEFATLRGGDLPLAEQRERIARVRLYVRDKTAPFFVGNRRRIDAEVQLLRIGEAAVLGLPFEPTTEVGLDWRERTRGRASGLAPATGRVAGTANGWLRYLPHPRDLAHPLAHHHYEVLSSLVAPGACERLLDAGESLLAETA